MCQTGAPLSGLLVLKKGKRYQTLVQISFFGTFQCNRLPNKTVRQEVI